MKILFRLDASITIGSGHLMRCLTLAEACQANGWNVYFACRDHPGLPRFLLQQRNYPLLLLPLLAHPPAADQGYQHWLGATETEDAAALLVAMQQLGLTPDLLIIDHYGLGADFQRQITPFCRHLMVIDDLANRPHLCDLLLDQNLLPDYATRYQQLLPTHCRVLLGPRYALLRREFQSTASSPRDFLARPLQVLVFFSGADGDNLTTLAIHALQKLQNLSWQADIVIGSANPHQSLLQQLCEEDARLTLHIQTPGMAELMQKAQLMVGGGGATHWERAAMALPALVISLAANQQATSAYLHQLGACRLLGDAAIVTETMLADAIAELGQDPDLLAAMTKSAAAIANGETLTALPDTGLLPGRSELNGSGCQAVVTAIAQMFDA